MLRVEDLEHDSQTNRFPIEIIDAVRCDEQSNNQRIPRPIELTFLQHTATFPRYQLRNLRNNEHFDELGSKEKQGKDVEPDLRAEGRAHQLQSAAHPQVQ